MEGWWPVPFVGGAVCVVVLATWLVVQRRLRRHVSAQAARDALKLGVDRTRRSFVERLDEAFAATGGEREDVFVGIEEALIAIDVGGATASTVVDAVRRRVGGVGDRSEVVAALRSELEARLGGPVADVFDVRPWVVLVVGINGVGKTTTVGKLAAMHRAAGREIVCVAADTFRAGAAEQLTVWAERSDASVVRQQAGASPAAVVFDGLTAARARGVDVVLIDTAGRLHTRSNLMEELRKIRRVIEREVPGGPHEVLLVMDATTGQNGIAQARAFVDAVGVTGVVISKLDGTARGGVILGVRSELGIPVRYIGVGEGTTDLRPFEAPAFVSHLFRDESWDRTR